MPLPPRHRRCCLSVSIPQDLKQRKTACGVVARECCIWIVSRKLPMFSQILYTPDSAGCLIWEILIVDFHSPERSRLFTRQMKRPRRSLSNPPHLQTIQQACARADLRPASLFLRSARFFPLTARPRAPVQAPGCCAGCHHMLSGVL